MSASVSWFRYLLLGQEVSGIRYHQLDIYPGERRGMRGVITLIHRVFQVTERRRKDITDLIELPPRFGCLLSVSLLVIAGIANPAGAKFGLKGERIVC